MLDRARFDKLKGDRSDADVAKGACVSASQLSQALSGGKGVSVSTLRRLADHLGASMDYLVGRDVGEPKAASNGASTQQEDGPSTGTDVPHTEAGEAEEVATDGMGAPATRGEVDMLLRQVNAQLAALNGEVAVLKAAVAELRQVSRGSGPDEGARSG